MRPVRGVGGCELYQLRPEVHEVPRLDDAGQVLVQVSKAIQNSTPMHVYFVRTLSNLYAYSRRRNPWVSVAKPTARQSFGKQGILPLAPLSKPVLLEYSL